MSKIESELTMKKGPKKRSLLDQVVDTKYDVNDQDCPHSPSMTIENLKRHDRILEKMRKAGISEEEIEFLGDFWQADLAHVWKLIRANEDFDCKKAAVN